MKIQKVLLAVITILFICCEDKVNKFDITLDTMKTDSVKDLNESEIISTWENQKLKSGEKIIYIKWGGGKTLKYGGGDCYCSEEFTVPSDKKWVLLYNKEIIETPTADYEHQSMMIIDGEVQDVRHTWKNVILSEAKGNNRKFYSGSKIIGFNRHCIKGAYCYDPKTDKLSGEICILEMSE